MRYNTPSMALGDSSYALVSYFSYVQVIMHIPPSMLMLVIVRNQVSRLCNINVTFKIKSILIYLPGYLWSPSLLPHLHALAIEVMEKA